MDFQEAIEEMKNGKKISRSKWGNEIFFKLDGFAIKSYRESICEFVYSEDIMISEGWVISEDNKDTVEFNYMNEYSFYEIISFLKEGYLAKPKEWNDAFIFFHPEDKMLVKNSMHEYVFVPLFGDFVAQDWVIIE